MADPTPERIAAALALAEAADHWYGHESTEEQPGWCAESKAMYRAMQTYRATALKLRTRSEVDAEIAKLTRECVEAEWADDDSIERWDAVTKLCREPTQDSPPPVGAAGAASHERVAEALGLYDGDNGLYVYADWATCLEEIAKNRREAELWRDHVRQRDEFAHSILQAHRSNGLIVDAGLQDPDPCGCEESEALKERLKAIWLIWRSGQCHPANWNAIGRSLIGLAFDTASEPERNTLHDSHR